MARVCISTPTKATMHADTVQWLLAEYTALAPDVEVHIVRDPRPLDVVRNEQVRRFLASACSHLFFLDSDCVPACGTLRRLLAYDVPFISAPHPSVIGVETGLMVLDAVEGGYVQHRPTSGLQRCDAVGCGGMLIRRDVLEAMAPPWFRFEMDAQGRLARGEDFGFCERLRAAGVEVLADCDLAQQHWVAVPL